MKKKLFSIVLFLMLLSQTAISAVTYITPKAPLTEGLLIVDIGYGVKISSEKLLTLTPKEYKVLTGHRLGFLKLMTLKAAQRKAFKQKGNAVSGNKNQIAAALICFFLGGLGIHRFYLGYTWQGVVQLLTFGGFGIWALIDLIRIILGDLEPKNGSYSTGKI